MASGSFVHKFINSPSLSVGGQATIFPYSVNVDWIAANCIDVGVPPVDPVCTWLGIKSIHISDGDGNGDACDEVSPKTFG